jgi:hypothetical protein
LLHLVHERRSTPATVNVYAAAITFLYRVTLKRSEVVTDVARLKTPMHLPRLVTGTEVSRLLVALPTQRLRAMAMLGPKVGSMKNDDASLIERVPEAVPVERPAPK